MGKLEYKISTDKQHSEYLTEPIPAPFVIFGVTAEGVAPLVATPNGPKYPHEVQATVLHTIVERKCAFTPSWSTLAET